MIKIQMRLSNSISLKPCNCPGGSAASRANTIRFSSSLSHLALAGPSGSNHKVATPQTSDGIPSRISIHCQPCRPWPFKPSSQPEIGAPITLDSGTAARNKAMNRARVAAGNQ